VLGSGTVAPFASKNYGGIPFYDTLGSGVTGLPLASWKPTSTSVYSVIGVIVGPGYYLKIDGFCPIKSLDTNCSTSAFVILREFKL
jgi:hypothetical protein